MVYPDNFEQKIAFGRIREMIAKDCIGSAGKAHVDQIRFLSDRKAIKTELDQTSEFKHLLSLDEGFHFDSYFDNRPVLERARIAGTFIEIIPLFQLKASLRTYHEIEIFIRNTSSIDLPELIQIIESVQWNSLIPDRIDRIMNERGEIRDQASPKLKEIRQDIVSKERAVQRKINQALKLAKQSGWTVKDASVSIRDGRQVIPVAAAHKRLLSGLVHDESATGQTVFIEPADVLEASNAVKELHAAEQREIIRILKDFTTEIRPEIPNLIMLIETLGRLDFIRAKAQLSISLHAHQPKLSDRPGLEWFEAVHPLLAIHHKQAGKSIVPLSIHLNDKHRILVISGPNAGGKSICLKTVGLLQYMLQCGLHIPVSEGSSSGIFSNLFIDIGDEQSIENDLSTYSSHLLNMKNMLEISDDNSLFLIDEFGTGTEPQLGGAIAESILEEMNGKKAFGVVTTHYSNLKLLAKQGNGIENGAMLFDTDQMEPLYRLAMGKPGSSFAFEIARKIGFPDQILKLAQQKTGKDHLDFDQQLQQLDIDKEKLRKQQEEFTVADRFLSEMIDKYESLNRELKEKKTEIISHAKKEALELISKSNKLIENTIKEIKEAGAEKKATKALRSKIEAAQLKLENEIENQNKNKKSNTGKQTSLSKAKARDKSIENSASQKIALGDSVKVAGQNVMGEVVHISGEDVIVEFNSIRFKTLLSKIERTNDKETKNHTSKSGIRSNSSISQNINDRLANFKIQLDVRGKRAEEALLLVQQYLDDAVLLNMNELKILHGKGNGILRRIIREQLRKLPEVKLVKDEHVERGGQGITIVILK